MRNRHVFMEEAEDGVQVGGGSGDSVEFGADGYKYADKYDTPQALEVGYKESVSHHTKKMSEMNEKLKGFAGSPENGEYTIAEEATAYSQPVMDSISNWGIENGLSQDAYNSLLSSVAKAESENLEAYKTEQMGLLGKNAQSRVDNINDKWSARFGDDALEWMNTKALSAQDVEMFESILAQGDASTVNPDGTKPMGEVMITQGQLSEAMFKKDSAGMNKMQTDPEYKRYVDEMTVKYNKQQGK